MLYMSSVGQFVIYMIDDGFYYEELVGFRYYENIDKVFLKEEQGKKKFLCLFEKLI